MKIKTSPLHHRSYSKQTAINILIGIIILLYTYSLFSTPLSAQTQSNPPFAATKDASNITTSSAELLGMIAPGESIDQRGFQFGTTTSYGQTLLDDTQLLHNWGDDGNGGTYFSTPPSDVATDSEGNVYVTSSSPGTKVMKFSPSGELLQEINGSATTSGSFSTHGIYIDSSNNLFVADVVNHKVLKYDPSGNLILEFGALWPGNSLYEDGLHDAVEVVTDTSGNIYVNDKTRIVKYNSSGSFIKAWGSPDFGTDYLQFSYGIAIDSSNHIYVTEVNGTVAHRIVVFDSEGNQLDAWGQYGSQEGNLQLGNTKIAFGSNGNLFILSSNNAIRIQEFTVAGEFVRSFGQGVISSFARGMTLDKDDNLYLTNVGSMYVLRGTIFANVTNLSCGTTYNYRAFATNSFGTTYGNNKTFSTPACPSGTTTTGTDSDTSETLSNTGSNSMLSIFSGLLLCSIAFCTYIDYRNHRQALVHAGITPTDYTYWHHLKVVSVPLMRYRLNVSLERALPGKSEHIRRF